MWYCLDCRATGPLDSHGRCSTCQSDAVVVAEAQARYQFPREQEVRQLEKMLERSNSHEKT